MKRKKFRDWSLRLKGIPVENRSKTSVYWYGPINPENPWETPDVKAIKAVLRGEIHRVEDAMYWALTQQGVDYWDTVLETDHLPSDGRAYLEWLKEEYSCA